ncbi:MAG: methyltransferase domain-containing protein [Gemmatimonadaceae bacterium]
MNFFRKLFRSARKRVMRLRWPSETAKVRKRLAPFCRGYGVDLGFGGDPILDSSIRVDLPIPYTKVGPNKSVQLGGDSSNLKWFKNDSLDYVYSSHLLEDFLDTRTVLKEWLRVLTPGGHLVLFCPDEQLFRAHCARTGQGYNPHHVHEDFSLAKVKGILAELGGTDIVHERDRVHAYSWELVCRKK